MGGALNFQLFRMFGEIYIFGKKCYSFCFTERVSRRILVETLTSFESTINFQNEKNLWLCFCLLSHILVFYYYNTLKPGKPEQGYNNYQSD